MIEVDDKQFTKIIKELFKYYCYKTKCNLNIVFEEKNDKYFYTFNYTENTSVYNFTKIIQKDYPQYFNVDWLFDYFNFQFTKWTGVLELKQQSKELLELKLHWIFGKKALTSFLNKTKQQMYFYHSKFFPIYQIKKEDIVSFLVKKNLIKESANTSIEDDTIITFNPLNIEEENLKKLKYNKIEGFYICLEYTTLFKYSSNFCKECTFKLNCKKFLRKTYPKLHQKRLARELTKKRLKENESK